MKFNNKVTRAVLSVGVCLTISLLPHQAHSQAYRREDNRSAPATLTQALPKQEIVTSVESVGMTVADMERAIEFYSQVLSFRKISDVEVWGSDYEHLQGLFGLRMRAVQM